MKLLNILAICSFALLFNSVHAENNELADFANTTVANLDIRKDCAEDRKELKHTKIEVFSSPAAHTQTMTVTTTKIHNPTITPLSVCCSKSSDEERPDPKYETEVIVAASFLLVFGAYMMFYSFPLFRITMAVTGLVLGASVSWIAFQAFEPTEGHPISSGTILGVCIGAGAALAIICIALYKVAMFLMCGMAGVMISLYVCSWHESFLLQNIYYRGAFSLLLMSLFLIGPVFLEFVIVIVSMGFIGAYLASLGIDLLIDVGFLKALQTLLDFNKRHSEASKHHLNTLLKRGASIDYSYDWRIYCMLGLVLGMAAISITWQMYFNKGNRFGLNIIRNTNDTLHKHK